MQWDPDSLRKAHAPKFYLKYFGPAVGICHFLSACPALCAWTGADHMNKLILMVLLMKTLDFVSQGSLSLDVILSCSWHEALFLFSRPSWEHVVHTTAKHKSVSIPVGKLQDWMQKFQTQPMSLLLLAKTQIYIYILPENYQDLDLSLYKNSGSWELHFMLCFNELFPSNEMCISQQEYDTKCHENELSNFLQRPEITSFCY